jgi:membrane protein YdbS with pleckstrin-like domain
MQQFTNEAIDTDQLPTYETVPLSKPHPSYWKVIIINLFIFLVLVGIALTVFIINVPEVNAQRYLIIGSYLVFAILLFAIYRASFKKRGYALREKDIIYKSGIIAETTTIVPLNRIQHVALDEGVFSRLFKLGKLQIYTAGGQSGHLMISGLEIEKAKNMKELLLRKLNQIDTQNESL